MSYKQAKHPWVQMCPSHFYIIQLMSYTVSTGFFIAVFDVQLQDDMGSYPGLFIVKNTRLNARMTPFYAPQNDDRLLWIALWQA